MAPIRFFYNGKGQIKNKNRDKVIQITGVQIIFRTISILFCILPSTKLYKQKNHLFLSSCQFINLLNRLYSSCYTLIYRLERAR